MRFCILHRNSRWPPKKWQERDFCKMSPVHSADTLRGQNFIEIALSGTVSSIKVLLRFMQKFKMAAKSGGKATLWPVDSADTLQVQNFIEIALFRTVSKINALLRFTQKFKMTAKSGKKAIFAKFARKLFIYLRAKNLVEIALSHTFI